MVQCSATVDSYGDVDVGGAVDVCVDVVLLMWGVDVMLLVDDEWVDVMLLVYEGT
jgi:hypothetical protein